jgi:ribosomal protein L11 methyltransferase
MQTYHVYSITADKETCEMLIAFLGQGPFDSFQETEDGFEAYVAQDPADIYRHQRVIKEKLEELQDKFDFNYSQGELAPQNWNAIWESNFQPIIVGDFCGIRADFHDPIKTVEHEIIINPKMAFGTGHHATTYMVIELMKELNFVNTKVLDFGCGTGILAILAAQLGAESIEAVDIEIESYENTIENAEMNNITSIKAFHGTLNDIQTTGFDIILANINRNVILESIPSLYEQLRKNGKLIVSGFLERDIAILRETATIQGFLPFTTKQKDNWVSMIFERA